MIYKQNTLVRMTYIFNSKIPNNTHKYHIIYDKLNDILCANKQNSPDEN